MNSGADYLVTFTEEKHSMINAKTYDYVAVRRPILVVPGDGALLSGLVNDLQAGKSLNNVADVKSFIHQAVQRKRSGHVVDSYPLKETDALYYTRRNQTKRLVDVLRRFFVAR
jgi:hypothetical protein